MKDQCIGDFETYSVLLALQRATGLPLAARQANGLTFPARRRLAAVRAAAVGFRHRTPRQRSLSVSDASLRTVSRRARSSRAARTRSNESRTRWPYVSSITFTDVPIKRASSKSVTPASSAKLAYVWRIE
jgi:hypothetical protein